MNNKKSIFKTCLNATKLCFVILAASVIWGHAVYAQEATVSWNFTTITETALSSGESAIVVASDNTTYVFSITSGSTRNLLGFKLPAGEDPTVPSNWVDITPSEGEVDQLYHIGATVADNGDVYVQGQYNTDKHYGRVYKYDGSWTELAGENWIDNGSYTFYINNYQDIEVASDNTTVYFAYRQNTTNMVKFMIWNGSDWTSQDLSTAADSPVLTQSDSGDIYIAYSPYGSPTNEVVKRWDGSQWEDLEYPGPKGTYTDMVFDNETGRLYLVFKSSTSTVNLDYYDTTNNDPVTANRWVTVDTDNHEATSPAFITLSMGPDNNLYGSYRGRSASYLTPHVIAFDKETETWAHTTENISVVGGFSGNTAKHDLNVLKDGTLAVIYRDISSSNGLTLASGRLKYTTTYTAGDNGSISGSTTQTTYFGEEGTEVTAVPDSGYNFVSWSDGNTSALRTDIVTHNFTVTASFEIGSYTVTYAADENGGVSGNVSQTIDPDGDATTVEAVPHDGYHFVSWSDNNENAIRTDTGITEDLSVSATFAINTYPVSYTSAGNGLVSGNTTQTITHNEDASTVEAIPTTGYHFVSWSDGNENASRTDTSITQNLTVTASFGIDTFSVSYSADDNGNVSGNTTQTINYNSDATTVTAIPITGYHFVSWSDDNQNASRTDTSITEDLTVTASFEIDTFSVAYSAGDNGSITGNSTQTINYNSDATTVTAIPDTGFRFVSWSDDNQNASRTDTGITENLARSATFEIIPPDSLSATASGNTVILSWTSPEANGASITIRRSTTSFPESITDGTSVATGITHSSYIDSELEDSTYYYSIFAVPTTGNISTSIVASTTVDTTPPNTPSLSAVKPAANGSSIDLSWDLPETTNTFKLTRTFGEETVIISDQISAETTSLSQTDLADGTYVYTLYAIDSHGNSSSGDSSPEVVIDTTKPEPPTLSASKTSSNGSTVTLSWDAIDGASSYRLTQSNGSSSTVLDPGLSSDTTSYSVENLADGTYTFTIFAIDAYSNVSTPDTTEEIVIDTTKPNTPTLSASKTSSNGSTVTLSWDSVEGASSFRLTQSNGSSSTVLDPGLSSNTTSYSVENLADGTYTFTIFAIDAYSNVSTPDTTEEVMIDTTKPDTPTLSASKTSSNGNTVNLSWDAIDGASSYRLTQSNGSSSTVLDPGLSSDTTSYSVESLADGTYTFTIFAIDAYSNVSTPDTTEEIVIDTTKPEPPTLSASKNSSNGSTVTLSWDAIDGASSYRLTQSNGSSSTVLDPGLSSDTTSYSVENLADGTYTFTIFAIDAYSNVSTPDTTEEIVIDTTKPDTPTLSASKNSSNGSTVTLSWDAIDGASSYRLTQSNGSSSTVLDPGLSSDTTSYSVENLADGTYTFTIFAIDAYSNVSTPDTTEEVVIDTTKPNTPTLSASKNSSNGSTVTLSWDSIEGASSFRLTQSNGSSSTVLDPGLSSDTTSYSVENLADGTYTFTIFAIDAYSNVSTPDTTEEIVIDTTKPEPPTLSASKTSSNGSTVTLSWDAIDGASSYRLTQSNGSSSTVLDPGLSSNTTSYSVESLADGTYTFTIFAIDAYSNVSTPDTTEEIVIDTTKPEPPTLSASKTSSNGNTVNLSWDAIDGASSYRLTQSNGSSSTVLDPGLSSDTTSYSVENLADGTYTFTIFAIDAYSNVSTPDTTEEIVIDTTKPEPPTLSASKNSSNGSTVTLSWDAIDGASSYRLTQSNGSSSTVLDPGLSSDTTSYSVENLADGTYTFTIFAIDAYSNVSTPDTTEEIVIDTTSPNTPTLNANKPTSNGTAIELTWNVPDTTTTFKLTRTFNDETTVVTENMSSSIHTRSETDLAEGRYVYTLYAIDMYQNMSSGENSSELTIDTTAPHSPSNFEAVASENTVLLTWEATSDTTAVTIRKSGNSYPESTTDGESVSVTTGNSSAFITEIADGDYYFAIFATDIYGNTGTSATATATVFATSTVEDLTENKEFKKGTVTIEEDVTTPIQDPKIGTNGGEATIKIDATYASMGTQIGVGSNSRGTIELSKPTSAWSDDGEVSIGAIGGTGTVNQTDGSAEFKTLVIGNGAQSNGDYILNGGTLSADSIEMGKDGGIGSFTWTDGQLQTSTFSGDLNNEGSGKLIIASNKPMTINGSYAQGTQSQTTFILETENPALKTSTNKTPTPLLKTTGTLTLSGKVELQIPGYSAKPGDSILLIERGQSVVSSISGLRVQSEDTSIEFVLPELDPRLAWDTSSFETEGTIKIVAKSSNLLQSRPLNYPNPFRMDAGTHIGYFLTEAADIELRVYTAYGSQVYKTTFKADIDEGAKAGYNKVPFSLFDTGVDLPSGVYPYLLIHSGKIVGRGRMVIQPR